MIGEVMAEDEGTLHDLVRRRIGNGKPSMRVVRDLRHRIDLELCVLPYESRIRTLAHLSSCSPLSWYPIMQSMVYGKAIANF